MTERDTEFLQLCHRLGLLKGPFLDVGSLNFNQDEGLRNLRDLVGTFGVEGAKGTDFQAGPGVDIVADFSIPVSEFEASWGGESFETVAIFNVLEHTFDPVTVLGNALGRVRSGGSLLVVVPSVWPIHNYPVDCVRLNPDWYRQFAGRHGLTLVEEAFCWLSEDFGIIPVNDLRQGDLDYYPSFHHLGPARNPKRYRMTTVVNKLFPTFFRTHWLPAMAALGAAFRKPA